MKINENQQKPSEIIENQRKPIENRGKSMKINENPGTSMKNLMILIDFYWFSLIFTDFH